MLPANFGSIWPSGFREDFFNISQSEKIINLGSHVCWPLLHSVIQTNNKSVNISVSQPGQLMFRS
jgi:hypothetical protein